MTLAIPISPLVEAKLRERAAAAGQSLDVYAARVLEAAAANPPAGSEDTTIALLRAWNEEDATDDPTEIAARQRDWEEFAASINAHHPANRKVYP